MRTSLKIILLVVTTLISSLCFTQSFYTQTENSKTQDEEKSFTLIYTKIHNTERLSEINAGFTSYLSKEKIKSRVRTLTVETSGETRYFDKLSRFKNVLKTPFIRFTTDVLVATDSEGHRLLLDADSLIPSHIKLVTIAYDGSPIRKSEKISHIASTIFFRENLKLGKRLFPGTKNVIVLTDESPYGEIEMNIAREQLGRSIDNILVHYVKIPKSNFREFISQINQYPKNTFIILSTWQLDSHGNYKFSTTTEPFLSQIEKFPVLVTQYLSVGSGALGGYTASAWDIGYKAAEIANNLDSTGIVYDTIRDYRLLFDYNVMKKWDVSVRDLPKNVQLLNRPDSLMENFRIEFNFILALFTILILSLLIFTLYHIRYRRLTIENEELAAENLKRKVLLDNTLSVMTEGVVSLDRDFRILEINKRAIQLSGSSGTCLGLKFDEVFSISQPAGKPSIENFMILALKSGIPQPLPADFVIRSSNSEYRFISGEISPVVDESDKIRQLVFVFRDITEFYRLSRFLRTAMESAMFYTWYFSPAENSFTYEENFRVITGKGQNRFKTLDEFLEMVHPEDWDNLKNHHSSAGASNLKTEISSVDFRLRRNNTYEWWQRRSIIQLSREDEGFQSYVYGMDININEYKQRERELLEAKRGAEESDRLKTAFLSNMSHEIRTPLNGIVGFSSLLSDNDYSQSEKAEFSEIINSNAKMLLGLINDILDLSRIESNTIKYEERRFSLNKQVEEIITLQQRNAAEGVKIISELNVNEIFIVYDRLRNYQILNNLVGNSIKFTKEGKITIGARVSEKFTEVYVSDTGKGMSATQMEKVFSRFYKADEFSTGSGLGLAICKAIVEFFGGTIRAESQEGKGTTITYTIPHRVLYEEKILEPHSVIDNNMEINITTDSRSRSNGTQSVLIAEDLESNYILLKIILSKSYNILWAKNGAEAVEMYKIHKPDLVLMDIKMPLMDGLEATRKIREESPFVPIIAQTANAFETDHRQALEAGCNDILTKPIKSKHLIEVVEKYINRV